MRFSGFTYFLAFASVNAYPKMGQTLKQIRAAASTDSTELIGDLTYLTDDQLSSTAASIKRILLSQETPFSTTDRPTVPDATDSACHSDTCCIWQHIADEFVSAFTDDDGQCNSLARQAIRMGFHDAGAWDKYSSYGGADGSLVLSDERYRSDNDGMLEVIQRMDGWYSDYVGLGYDISMADLVQTAAKVGTVVCPLGPRSRLFIGRISSSTPAPEGLLPSPFSDAPTLISLFDNKTIGSNGLVALVGAHSTSTQSTVDASQAGAPQDSTPGVWDTAFYGQTVGGADGVFRFPSDIALSGYSTTSAKWASFMDAAGQDPWNNDYAREYIRLSLLGVNNINQLVECSGAMPYAKS